MKAASDPSVTHSCTWYPDVLRHMTSTQKGVCSSRAMFNAVFWINKREYEGVPNGFSCQCNYQSWYILRGFFFLDQKEFVDTLLLLLYQEIYLFAVKVEYIQVLKGICFQIREFIYIYISFITCCIYKQLNLFQRTPSLQSTEQCSFLRALLL